MEQVLQYCQGHGYCCLCCCSVLIAAVAKLSLSSFDLQQLPSADQETQQDQHSYSQALCSLTGGRLARPVPGKIKKIRV